MKRPFLRQFFVLKKGLLKKGLFNGHRFFVKDSNLSQVTETKKSTLKLQNIYLALLKNSFETGLKKCDEFRNNLLLS